MLSISLKLEIDWWGNFWKSIFLGLIVVIYALPLYGIDPLNLLIAFTQYFLFGLMATNIVDAIKYWKKKRAEYKALKGGGNYGRTKLS